MLWDSSLGPVKSTDNAWYCGFMLTDERIKELTEEYMRGPCELDRWHEYFGAFLRRVAAEVEDEFDVNEEPVSEQTLNWMRKVFDRLQGDQK